MKIAWKQVLAALLAGLLAGAGLGRLRHLRRPSEQQRLERFSRKLNLSPDQTGKAARVFEKGREKMDALRAETRGELRALLKPEQLPEFERMEAKWQKRLERR